VPTRWVDQGAVQALPVLRVRSRQQSGFAEVMFRQHVPDRTNWRAMLKGDNGDLNLADERDRLLALCSRELADLENQFGLHAISVLKGVATITINYPVLEYPDKISSFNFDKDREIAGSLVGIKGQYLILDTGVVNLRRFSGYQVRISAT